jgi:RNA polymerase sigma factor (sigma-70 family)
MVKGYLALAPAHAQAGASRLEDQPDGHLLQRFARKGDEVAFAVLVRRHGPMVLGVCRRVLRHSQDAEDAFQATFLVLVRKAGALGQPELLANWLYGVAYRTAQHARAQAARRSQHERKAASMCADKPEPDPAWQELRELLDEELFQLPEKYRAPLVLCYLEGKTNEEAARVLGWPPGSMSARLARGREMLRDRLTGRRRALAALAPGLLASRPEIDDVSPLLADTTVQAAVVLLGTRVPPAGLVSQDVGTLMEATLRALRPPRRSWLWPALVIATAALLLGTVASAATSGWPLNQIYSPAASSPSLPTGLDPGRSTPEPAEPGASPPAGGGLCH